MGMYYTHIWPLTALCALRRRALLPGTSHCPRQSIETFVETIPLVMSSTTSLVQQSLHLLDRARGMALDMTVGMVSMKVSNGTTEAASTGQD